MHSSYLFANGLRIHYLYWNHQSDGQPVVLLHGLASNAHIWELAAPELAARGLPLWAWEARGHGLTDKPDDGYDFVEMERDLAAFLDACNLEKPLLVGHSWGGALALEYAARVPVGPRSPAGLVLVDGGFVQMNAAPGADWETISQRLAPPNLQGMPLDELRDNMLRWTADWLPQGEAGEKIVEIYLHSFAVDGDERVAPNLSYPHHMAILRSIWEFNTYERFSRVNCPVLMLPARPPNPDEMQTQHLALKQQGIDKARQTLPDLQVHWMDSTIHDVPLQRPSDLARLIADFSAALPDGRG